MTDTKELTTVERAEQALGLATLKPQLEALVLKSANVQTITNKAGRDECHSYLMTLKSQRVAIEKTGKEAREEATRYSKAVIAAEKTLIDILTPEETRLAALRQEWDDARQHEKDEAERLERERVQAMVDGIAAINAIPGKLFGAGVSELTQAIHDLRDNDLAWADEVYAPSANKAKQETLERLVAARDEREELDRQAAENLRLQQEREAEAKAAAEKLAAERAAFEAEQAEARKAQEEADRKAAEARAEADRAAQAERDRIAAELQAEVDAARAEQAKRQAELDRREQEAREQAEADAKEAARRAAEEQAAREAQEAQERAEQAARADHQHRESVRAGIAAELVERGLILTAEDAGKLVYAIDQGEIENLSIMY